jgi:uncharacterized phage infection (PIP) family protein YhgE
MERVIEALRKLIKDFSKMPQVTQLVVAGVLVLVAFNMGQCDSDSQLNKFRAEFSVLQKEATDTKHFADSVQSNVIRLADESKKKDSVITRLSFTIDFTNKQRTQLKGNLVKLEDSLRVVKDTAELIAIQEGIIYNLKDQVANAESVIENQKQVITTQQFKITKLDSAVALATQRGDSLQTVVTKLINMPKPPRQWISKKTAGMIAFATGVIVGDQLARR